MVALLRGQYIERIYGEARGRVERQAMKDSMTVWAGQGMCAGKMR